MEKSKYRFIMGILAVLLACTAFLASLTACVLLTVFQDAWTVLFLPLLIAACTVTVLSGIFSVINSGSKLGMAGLIITAASVVCLIVAFTQI